MPLSRAGGAGLEGGILRAFPIFNPRLYFGVALTLTKRYFVSYFGQSLKSNKSLGLILNTSHILNTRSKEAPTFPSSMALMWLL